MKTEDAMKKKKKGERTKQKLFDSAVRLFEKYDSYEVTVDAIVEAAGVSKGTFYIYFESKDALIVSFLEDYVSGLDAEYKAHLDSMTTGTKASDMLLSLIGKIADVLNGTIGNDLMRTVYKMQLAKDVNMDAVKGYNRPLYKMIADVLGRGVEQGEFVTGLPLDALTKHFMMAIRGLVYEWCIRYPDFELREQALDHCKILLNGIKIKERKVDDAKEK